MNLSMIINKYIGLNEIEKTGWKNRGIKDPESISEHVMSCIFIAFSCLPQKIDPAIYGKEYDYYNKEAILNLLIIHDLGENDVGDIVRGTKTEEQKKREFESVIRYLNGINFNGDNDYEYLKDLWLDMESGHPKNINAIIAKEIDYIQGTYQYFRYCILGKVIPTVKSCTEWLDEISDERIHTAIGRFIREKIVYENQDFKQDNFLKEYFD